MILNVPITLFILSFAFTFILQGWYKSKKGKPIKFTMALRDALALIGGFYVTLYVALVMGFKMFNISVSFPQDDLVFIIVIVYGLIYYFKEVSSKYIPKKRKRIRGKRFLRTT
jgi:hypothetical protein